MRQKTCSKKAYRPMLWLLVLISIFFIPTVSLADNSVSLKLESASVEPGSEVQVPIIIEKNAGIASLKFSVAYDQNVLTLTNVKFPKNTGTYSCAPEPFGTNQVINFVSPLSAFTKTGTFATLTFTVNEDAALNKASSITIDYDEDDIFDAEFNEVPFVALSGAIYVSEESPESMAVLPSTLTRIEEESFMNTSFYYVVLPETTTEIGSKAFAYCPNLQFIYIPEATTQIADNAFLNVTNLTIYGKAGSYAETYANMKGYDFEAQ
jgi:hypothetical protein